MHVRHPAVEHASIDASAQLVRIVLLRGRTGACVNFFDRRCSCRALPRDASCLDIPQAVAVEYSYDA